MNNGVKEQGKLPIYTVLSKQFPNALKAIVERSLIGHEKYKKHDEDFQNFLRVPNAVEEYSNAMIRHSLCVGEDTELDHYIATAWNSIARLECYLQSKNSNPVVSKSKRLNIFKYTLNDIFIILCKHSILEELNDDNLTSVISWKFENKELYCSINLSPFFKINVYNETPNNIEKAIQDLFERLSSKVIYETLKYV